MSNVTELAQVRADLAKAGRKISTEPAIELTETRTGEIVIVDLKKPAESKEERNQRPIHALAEQPAILTEISDDLTHATTAADVAGITPFHKQLINGLNARGDGADWQRSVHKLVAQRHNLRLGKNKR